jgi:hypothetical protein
MVDVEGGRFGGTTWCRRGVASAPMMVVYGAQAAMKTSARRGKSGDGGTEAHNGGIACGGVVQLGVVDGSIGEREQAARWALSGDREVGWGWLA